VFVPYIPQDCFAGRPGGRIIRPSLLEILEAAADRGKDPAAADVIVAGGNGAGPEGFKLIEELAELLHGAVGASRIAVDKGWISHSHLIGQSGITVAPSLYINCGISGSVQHIVGMRDAKCVISINKDPRALIFNVSDYGIVGDLHKVLPALIAEIRRHRA
jgi:electron transfer flavoprotein alpha subunit